jgi:hypothetical protein
MPDYREKLEEWHRVAREKARELDEKYDIRSRVEEGVRAAHESVKQGAETIGSTAERARAEAERLETEYELTERARVAAEEAARRAREARDAFRDAAGSAGQKAGEVFEGAKKQYERASKVYNAGAGLTRATAAATSGLLKAGSWITENPGKAAMVSFSLVLGVRGGISFPGLDAVLIGSHPHWLTHSALPVWGITKAAKKFDEYLSRQEQLAASGELDQAERERVEFERKIVKYVGAPLLGAFSCAAGAAMWAQIIQPGHITGVPISWLLGGNPFLEAVWLFGNGLICFQQGYKLFMIALADQDEVTRVVREIKGLLPMAAQAS